MGPVVIYLEEKMLKTKGLPRKGSPLRPAGTSLFRGGLPRDKVRFLGPPSILSYGVSVLSVLVVLVISRLLDIYMRASAPTALFFCAIMFSTWWAGLKPGFLAMAFSLLALKYYYVSPVCSLALNLHEIPRLLINTLAAFFVVIVSAAQRNAMESMEHARNVLDDAHKELQRANESLRLENTERQRVERQSRELIDVIPHQIWSGPPDGTLDYCNERWRSFMGLRLTELQGDGWQSMLHPEDRARVLDAWRESVANG